MVAEQGREQAQRRREDVGEDERPNRDQADRHMGIGEKVRTENHAAPPITVSK